VFLALHVKTACGKSLKCGEVDEDFFAAISNSEPL
jgi:hypothetical protein